MTIYVDSLFVLNTVLNYLLLLGSARLSGAVMRRLRLLGAAALGGLYAVGCVVPGLEVLRELGMKLVILALMILIAFGCRKAAIKQTLVFLGLSFAFGGIMLVMVNVLGTSLMLIHGAAYYPVSGRALVLTAAVVYLLSRTVLARIAEHSGAQLVPVEIFAGDRRTSLTALRDTGNTLKDPVTNQSVLVADWHVARQLLPPEVSAALTAEQFRDPVGLFERMNQTFQPRKWRLLPYRTVGTPGGMLLAMKCDQIILGKQKISGGLVAFSPNEVGADGTYTALTGGSV